MSQATAAPVSKAEPKTTPAFLYGESVADPKAPPAAGFTIKRIKWTLGTEGGASQWPLEEKQNIVPVCKTVVLKKGDDKWVLLGPKGEEIELSLKKGPLADARPGTLSTPTFSYTPDGKTLAFVNEAGDYCRITLEEMELTVSKVTGLSPFQGIEFSADGQRIAYARIANARITTIFTADIDVKNEVEVVQSEEHMGFSFLSEGRLGVVTKIGMTTYDGKSGKEVQAVQWKEPLSTRGYPALSPDGSALVFIEGGPYQLSLYHFDIKTEKDTQVREQYLESFQRPVWVKVPAE